MKKSDHIGPTNLTTCRHEKSQILLKLFQRVLLRQGLGSQAHLVAESLPLQWNGLFYFILYAYIYCPTSWNDQGMVNGLTFTSVHEHHPPFLFFSLHVHAHNLALQIMRKVAMPRFGFANDVTLIACFITTKSGFTEKSACLSPA